MSVWREIKELISLYIYIYNDLLLWVRALFESVSLARLLDITNCAYQTTSL